MATPVQRWVSDDSHEYKTEREAMIADVSFWKREMMKLKVREAFQGESDKKPLKCEEGTIRETKSLKDYIPALQQMVLRERHASETVVLRNLIGQLQQPNEHLAHALDLLKKIKVLLQLPPDQLTREEMYRLEGLVHIFLRENLT